MNTSEALLNDAEKMLTRGLFVEALEAFSRAPGGLPSALGVARTRLALGQLNEAARSLDALIRQFPDRAEPLTYRGVVEERRGRMDGALEFYRRATSANSESAVALFNLGRALAQKRQWPEALRMLEAARNHQPHHPTYHYVLGTAYQLAGRTGEAIEAISVAVALDPQFVDGYITLADLLVVAGRAEIADELLAEALKRFDHVGVLHSKRAAIAVRRGDLRAAIKHLEEQTRCEPDSEKAWLSLATFRLMGLDLSKAEQALRRALELNPKNARTHYQLGVIFDTCRLPAEATREFRTAIECDPSFWKSYNNLGTLLMEDRKDPGASEAVKLLERAVEKAPAPERPTAAYNLALAYWKAGRKSDSAKAARDAAKGPPGNPAAENARRFMSNFA